MPCARFAPVVTDCGVAARRGIDAARRALSHAISFAGARAFLQFYRRCHDTELLSPVASGPLLCSPSLFSEGHSGGFQSWLYH